MMRAFVIALFTFVVLLATPFSGSAAAQPPPSYPLEFTGGTPGVSIEIFLNAGRPKSTASMRRRTRCPSSSSTSPSLA